MIGLVTMLEIGQSAGIFLCFAMQETRRTVNDCWHVGMSELAPHRDCLRYSLIPNDNFAEVATRSANILNILKKRVVNVGSDIDLRYLEI